MSQLRRVATVALGALVVLLWAYAVPAAAAVDKTLQDCLDRAEDHGGEPPSCTSVSGGWVASWDDDPSSGWGAAVAILLVVAIALSIGFTVWRVNAARGMAERSGMDPDLAARMTMLDEDGLSATYLASSLRQQNAAAAAPPSVPRPAAERLTELKALLDQGLLTQAEYDERRRAVIDGL